MIILATQTRFGYEGCSWASGWPGVSGASSSAETAMAAAFARSRTSASDCARRAVTLVSTALRKRMHTCLTNSTESISETSSPKATPMPMPVMIAASSTICGSISVSPNWRCAAGDFTPSGCAQASRGRPRLGPIALRSRRACAGTPARHGYIMVTLSRPPPFTGGRT